MTRKHDAERNAVQPTEDDDEGLEQPERVPSLLTARELQAKDPAKVNADETEAADRDDDEDAGERGQPMPKTTERQNAGRRSR